MTNQPKTATKYRVYTGLQRVTLPVFVEAKASPSLKRKGLLAKIGHYLSLRKSYYTDWVSFT